MYEKFFKRILDFLLSLIALAVLSPILLILTVVGAIAMKGNPFFVQKRPIWPMSLSNFKMLVGIVFMTRNVR